MRLVKPAARDCCKCGSKYVSEEYAIDRHGGRFLASICYDCGHIEPINSALDGDTGG